LASTLTPPRSPSRRFLPPDPRTTGPYRLTPQIAFRIAILATILVAAFAALFLRLWVLQILSGSEYLNAAQNNQLRIARIQPPRGQILDRHGVVLVDNAAGHSVQILPADLPEEGRYAMLKRLSRLLNVPVPWMVNEIQERKNDPLTPIVVKRGIHEDQLVHISEHREDFRGVRVVRSYLRRYPHKALGAHLLGHVGEVNEDQLAATASLWPGDEIGQGGIEGAYDKYLRGEPGTMRVRVDSLGRPLSSPVPTNDPKPGNSLRLTIDYRLQKAAEAAIRYGIALAHQNEEYYANGGAVVAMNPNTGEILALASNPTFRPSVYVGDPDPRKLKPLVDDNTAARRNFPSLNRATAGRYAPGSTWKPVTALAAIQAGILSPFETLPCTGYYTSPNEKLPESQKQVFRNWDPYVNEAMTLRTALSRSCDTYFYALGDEFFALPPEFGHPLQSWASRFGFGELTGVDVGPEDAGLLPTPEWRQRTFTTEIERLWKPGDSIQLAIGQKDLLVTPLQMTRFYALVANGGKLVTPHVVAAAEQPGRNGGPVRTLQRFTPPAPQQMRINQQALAAVREGLWLATHEPLGTSAGTFASFPVDVAGKTGTAEKYSAKLRRMLDQSWWCGYAPADNPQITVCALIENGGHGGSAAAPAALKVFEAYFDEEASVVVPEATD
jgi:penicillin-binding protein 2